MLIAVTQRPRGIATLKAWITRIIIGLPGALMDPWLVTILETADQGPKPPPPEGWPHDAAIHDRRKIRPISLMEHIIKLADDIVCEREVLALRQSVAPEQQGTEPLGIQAVVGCLRGYSHTLTTANDGHGNPWLQGCIDDAPAMSG